MPWTTGVPSARVPMIQPLREPGEQGRPTLPENSGASQSCSASGLRPEIWVRPVIPRVMPMVRPRRMKRPPSVTMKDGRPVVITIRPLT